MKKILLVLILGMFLLGGISAFNFDNSISYSNKDMTIDFRNSFGFGKDLGGITLTSHKSIDEILEVGAGEYVPVMIYDNVKLYGENLGDVEFIDKNIGESVNKDYYFAEWKQVTRIYDKYSCVKGQENLLDCEEEKTGTYEETNYEWVRIEDRKIPRRDTRIALITDVQPGDYYDAVWTVAGKKIKKHAEWTESLSANIGVYYSLDETSGTTLQNNVSSGTNDAEAKNGTVVGASGKLGNSIQFDGVDDIALVTDYTRPTDAATVNFWTKGTDVSNGVTEEALVAQNEAGDQWLHVTLEQADRLRSKLFTAGADPVLVGTTNISDKDWHMGTVTMSLAANNVSLYVDGVLEATDSIANALGSGTGFAINEYGVHNIGGSAEFSGYIDEIGIWERALTTAEVQQLYNAGSGIPYANEFDFVPVVTLNSPTNYTNSTTNEITFNCTASDAEYLINNSLYLDGAINETNSSGLNNSFYYFTKILSDGNHYWSCSAQDNNTQITTAGEFLVNVNTTPNIAFGSGVPIDEYNSTINHFEANGSMTETYFKNITFDLYRNGILNQSVTFTNSSRSKEWTNLADGNYSYNITGATTTNQFNSTATRNIHIDSNNPALDIFYPTSAITSHIINTNLSVNWSVNDSNLATCILGFNGENRTVTCNDNQTQINITNSLQNNLTMWANDTFGNINSTTISWSYTIFENSFTFSTQALEGSEETFSENITLNPSKTISSVSLTYNGTEYSGSASASNGNYILMKEIVIPDISTDANLSFYWSVLLSDGQIINLTSNNQTVLSFSVDNCGVNTNTLYKYYLLDEEEQTLLQNTSMELSLTIYDSNYETQILNYSHNYDDVNPAQVCINTPLLNSTNYTIDSTVKYNSNQSGIDGYAVEYYNILKGSLNNLTGSTTFNNISLYDLLSADSTVFKITFRGSDYSPVENALIYLDRQYVSENAFKTIELPKTDSSGQTVGHLVRNDIVYNIVVIKDNEVIGNFQNVRAYCEDYTIGNCEIQLDATSDSVTAFNYNSEIGITFSALPVYNTNTSTISFSFSTYDGTSKDLFMEVERQDIFGNRSLCNHSVSSSSGTLSCSIDPDIDETTIKVSVYVDELILTNYIDISGTSYGSLGYVIWFFLTLILILILGDDKTTILLSMFASYIGAVLMGIANGSIVGIGSAGIWILVITILGIWKINKEKPQ